MTRAQHRDLDTLQSSRANPPRPAVLLWSGYEPVLENRHGPAVVKQKVSRGERCGGGRIAGGARREYLQQHHSIARSKDAAIGVLIVQVGGRIQDQIGWLNDTRIIR